MNKKCDRCEVKYDDIYDTIVMYDFSEPGRGKPGHYHICLNCRKELIKWLEATK